MKYFQLIPLIVCLFAVSGGQSFGQQQGFGIGLILGEPTGISMKGWLSHSNALDAGVAWSFRRETSLHIHADYLWHDFDVFNTKEEIPLYFGIGGRIKTGHNADTRFGARVVVGVEYFLRDAPIDFFFEIAPIVDLAPSTELDGNAGVGARFWFR